MTFHSDFMTIERQPEKSIVQLMLERGLIAFPSPDHPRAPGAIAAAKARRREYRRLYMVALRTGDRSKLDAFMENCPPAGMGEGR